MNSERWSAEEARGFCSIALAHSGGECASLSLAQIGAAIARSPHVSASRAQLPASDASERALIEAQEAALRSEFGDGGWRVTPSSQPAVNGERKDCAQQANGAHCSAVSEAQRAEQPRQPCDIAIRWRMSTREFVADFLVPQRPILIKGALSGTLARLLVGADLRRQNRAMLLDGALSCAHYPATHCSSDLAQPPFRQVRLPAVETELRASFARFHRFRTRQR